MSQKLRAVRRTAGMLAIATVIPVVMFAFFQLPIQVITWILLAGVVSYFVWLVYSINLGQIKHDDAMEEIANRQNDFLANKKV